MRHTKEKETIFAKGEQTNSFGKQKFKQRMLDKSSPQVTAQSARSIRQDTREGDDEADDHVLFDSAASGGESSQAESSTSSMRTEITDSEPES